MNRRAFLILVCSAVPAMAQSVPSVSVTEAHQRLRSGKSVLVDIRRPEEWAETGTPEGAIRLDMEANDFVPRLAELQKANPGRDIDIICRTANRTSHVQRVLSRAGWGNVVNVRGGVAGNGTDPGWIAAGLPVRK